MGGDLLDARKYFGYSVSALEARAMIYKIPIIGFIVSIIEYGRVYRAYGRSNKAYWKVADKGIDYPEYWAAYNASCDAYSAAVHACDNTFKAFLWTVGPLLVARIILAFL